MPAEAASAASINWNDRARHWAKAAPAGAPTASAMQINRNLIACARLKPGDHVLDLASGTGEPAISMALAVGHGSVTATDATQAMLDVAITRAAKLGLENISFQVTPMEAIAYPDNRFDAVTCRFGLMHSDDAAAGLSQARRVLKPGGRAAFVVHGPAAPNNQWWLVHGAANEFFGSPSDARPARRNRYSGEGETGVLLQAAGFTDIEEKLFTTEIRHRIVPDGGGPAIWRPMLERDFAQPLADLDAAAAAELEQRLAAAFAEFQDGDEYVLSASQRITTGVK